MTSVHATGSFTFTDWQEQTLGEADGGQKIAQASVTNHFSGAIEAAGTSCSYSIAYDTGKAGVFSGYELLDGALDGRKGSFVLEQRGTFGADGTVHCAFEVVPGSGTGELTGLTGTGGFTAVHGEPSVPYTFDYGLPEPSDHAS